MARLAPLILVALTGLLVGAAPAPAKVPTVAGTTTRSLTTGFTDPVFLTNMQDQRVPRFREARAVGADVVRIDMSWWGVADKQPEGDTTDPGNPGYDWSTTDAALRDANARGLQVLFNLFRAPPWAEGPDRPADAGAGTWRPDAAAYGLFAKAAARRYSGGYPDPLQPGRNLPRVRYWEAWNEPNLWVMLMPQWVRSGGQTVPASPGIYRSLLNALYDGVKSVSADNVVIGGSMSPYGDPPGGDRMPPARFARELFCLNGNSKPVSCPAPPRLDVLDHHPYSVGGPNRAALSADDVSTPDMYKLSAILRSAEKYKRVFPAGRKRLWVTEISWESRPPDPSGVFALQHARWLAYSFYRLWVQDVETVLWYQVRDEVDFPNFTNTFQSGIELSNGTPKPTAKAFKFPFVAERLSSRSVRIWGKTPDPGTVRVQTLSGGRWRTLAMVRPGGNRVFVATLLLKSKVRVRAVSRDGVVSLDWPPKANLISVDPKG